MERRHALVWVALAGLAVGAFWDGLYAPAQQLLCVALAALLALIAPQGVRFARLEWVALLLLAVGVAGGLWDPAAVGVAAHGPVVVAGWILAFVAGRALRRQGVELVLARFWAVLGASIAFAGLLLISFTPPHHSGRLASFLGYPIAVGMAGLLGLAGVLPDLAEGRRWAAPLALGSVMGLLLSGSRGVWAVALLLGTFLCWAAPALVRAALPRLGLTLGAGLAAALWAAPAVAQRDAPRLALVVLLALLTVAVVERFHRVWPVRLAAAAGVAAVLLLAPGWGWLWGRAAALPLTEGSSVERLAFLRDGLRLSAGLPWGAGYRAWASLHLQAASYGYYSAEVHSALLDVALAYGWAGAAAFALLVARLLLHLRQARTWRPGRTVLLAGLGALAVHALVDWDLSYGLFAFPLWFGFGLVDPVDQDGRPARATAWPRRLTVGLAGLALAGAALLGAGDLFTELAARGLARGEAAVTLRHAGAAVAVTPWNDLAHAYRGEALNRLGRGEEGLAALARARALGPREPWYARLAAAELERQGRWLDAAAAWSDYVRLWPWEAEAYEAAVRAHLDCLELALAAGDRELAAALAESGERVLAALDRQKAAEPASAPRAGMAVDRPIFGAARERFQRVLAAQ